MALISLEFVELLLFPTVEPPGPSFLSAWFTLALLALAARRLAPRFRRPSGLFLFGAIGSAVFVVRMSEVLRYRARHGIDGGDIEAAMMAILGPLVCGAVCYGAGLNRQRQSQSLPTAAGDSVSQPPIHPHSA